MFSREEASKLRQQFWITFGKYMKPINNAEGISINWINYKTGVKHVFFKMDAEQKFASIAIEITHPDSDIRDLVFEQFQEFKVMFENAMEEVWHWDAEINDFQGKPVARIEMQLPNVSVFNQQHWPEIISFLKPRIIALDNFWCDVKPVFERLSH